MNGRSKQAFLSETVKESDVVNERACLKLSIATCCYSLNNVCFLRNESFPFFSFVYLFVFVNCLEGRKEGGMHHLSNESWPRLEGAVFFKSQTFQCW